jgi:hypothetical protein
VNETKRRIDDYAATARARISQLRGYSGKQPGDPVRAARAIVDAVESPNPPHHLLLGNAAYDLAMAKLDVLRKEFAAWEAVSRGLRGGVFRRSRARDCSFSLFIVERCWLFFNLRLNHDFRDNYAGFFCNA